MGGSWDSIQILHVVTGVQLSEASQLPPRICLAKQLEPQLGVELRYSELAYKHVTN